MWIEVQTWAACSADIKEHVGQLPEETEEAGFCLGCGVDLGLPHFHAYPCPDICLWPEGYCSAQCGEGAGVPVKEITAA